MKTPILNSFQNSKDATTLIQNLLTCYKRLLQLIREPYSILFKFLVQLWCFIFIKLQILTTHDTFCFLSCPFCFFLFHFFKGILLACESKWSLCMSCSNVNFLVLIMCYSYIRCYLCKKLGEVYTRTLCSSFTINCFKQEKNFKNMSCKCCICFMIYWFHNEFVSIDLAKWLYTSYIYLYLIWRTNQFHEIAKTIKIKE